MVVCKICGREVEDREYVTYNVLTGFDEVYFCSWGCLKSYVNRKKAGLIISLLIGVIACAVMLIAGGSETVAVGLLFLFLPYMLRWLFAGKRGYSEVVAFFIVFLGAFTFIFPIIKVVQEIREYKFVTEKYGLKD